MKNENFASTDPFTHEWVDWILENLRLDVEEDKMLEAMCNDGIKPETARVMISTLRSATRFARKRSSSMEEKKMNWLLEALASLDSVGSRNIVKKDSVSIEDFYDLYYSKNEPLLLTNWSGHRLLRDMLSWTHLASEIGDEEVEVQFGRNSDARYERNSNEHKKLLKFRSFLTQVVEDCENNDVYLTANNGKRNRDVFSFFTQTSNWMPEFLSRDEGYSEPFLWIGPKGTVTQLHHDLTNNLLLQVKGRKRVFMFPPCYFKEVYNDYHCYSDFDCENPDYDKFPKTRKIRVREVILEEGQALFLPVGWWHQIRSLSVSISITAVNFQRANDMAQNYTTYESIR